MSRLALVRRTQDILTKKPGKDAGTSPPPLHQTGHQPGTERRHTRQSIGRLHIYVSDLSALLPFSVTAPFPCYAVTTALMSHRKDGASGGSL
jgi:hypothetical protein